MQNLAYRTCASVSTRSVGSRAGSRLTQPPGQAHSPPKNAGTFSIPPSASRSALSCASPFPSTLNLACVLASRNSRTTLQAVVKLQGALHTSVVPRFSG